MSFKMLICDDIKYMCQYFKNIFEEQKDFEVIATATNKKEIVKCLNEYKPDVVLLDIQMDTAETGIELIPYIKFVVPDANIIMLTVNEDKDMIFKAIELGADNYVLKTNDISKIIEIVTRTCKKDIVFEGVVAKKIIENFSTFKSDKSSLLLMIDLITNLSKSELAIVNLLCQGYTPKEISSIRVVEYSTVRSQITLILKKTGYTNYKQLVNDILKSGAIDFFDKLPKNHNQQ